MNAKTTNKAPKKSAGKAGKKAAGTAKKKAAKGAAELAPLAAFRDEMDRALGRFLSDDWTRGFPHFGRMWGMPSLLESGRGAVSAMMGMPRADLVEAEDRYELTVELPGMDENDLELTLSEGMLSLKGEKKEEKEVKEKDYHMTERSYGSIQRRFSLPPGVDVEKMDAHFAKGVLTVVLPKTAEAQTTARKIEVRTD